MKRYVALLRGINVGGNNKVSMKELKVLFEELGFTNISTYINSGNVIFESTNQKTTTELTNNIEATLGKSCGFPIRTLVIPAITLSNICAVIPAEWNNDTKMKTDVLFLWDQFDNKKTLKLINTNPDVDHLIYESGAIIWNLDRADYNKSGMNKFIGTEVYKHMTARNINTVRKLWALLQAN